MGILENELDKYDMMLLEDSEKSGIYVWLFDRVSDKEEAMNKFRQVKDNKLMNLDLSKLEKSTIDGIEYWRIPAN